MIVASTTHLPTTDASKTSTLTSHDQASSILTARVTAGGTPSTSTLISQLVTDVAPTTATPTTAGPTTTNTATGIFIATEAG